MNLAGLTDTRANQARVLLRFSRSFGPRMECADQEHADPGTGNPPQPREKPVEKDASEGWRVDTPWFLQDEE